MGHLLFKCPQTGLNVQHWVEDAPDDPSDAYKPVVCQACTKLHFINISNGKLLGEERSKAKERSKAANAV